MTPHESSTMMDSELLFGIEHVLSDMDELDYALLEQSMAEATGQDAPGDRRISGRKRTFSSVGEAVCENAAAEAAARPCSPVQAGDAPDMGRVERKKSRERMRRVEVNDRFEELQKLLTAIEPALAPPGKAAAKPAAAVNRVELLTRAIRVMRRLWQDRQSGCATPTSTVTLTPAVPPPAPCAAAPAAAAPAAAAPVAPAPPLLAPALGAAAGGMGMLGMPNMMHMQAMMAAAAAQQQQQQGAKAAGGGSGGVGGAPQMPMMMLMPMFMPQPAAAAAPPQQCTPPPQQQPQPPLPLAVAPLQKPFQQQLAEASKHLLVHQRLAAPLPHFVAAALSEEDSTEAPTHAVCA